MRDIFGRGKEMHLINWRISFRFHLCKGATDNRIETASGNDHRECRSHVPSTHDYATTPCKDGSDWLKNWLSALATRRRRRVKPAQVDHDRQLSRAICKVQPQCPRTCPPPLECRMPCIPAAWVGLRDAPTA